MSPSAVATRKSEAVAKLFDDKSPVLVEVRFPGLGTSPDWYLCREEAELEPILARLGSGAKVRLHSVWDLHDPTGGITPGT